MSGASFRPLSYLNVTQLLVVHKCNIKASTNILTDKPVVYCLHNDEINRNLKKERKFDTLHQTFRLIVKKPFYFVIVHIDTSRSTTFSALETLLMRSTNAYYLQHGKANQDKECYILVIVEPAFFIIDQINEIDNFFIVARGAFLNPQPHNAYH